MKIVTFHGYEIEVPASWPVYQLDLHPDQCIRYDVHAVYLGAPGDSQNCPAGLVGRTETISIGAPAGDVRPPIAGGPGAASSGAGRVSQRVVMRGEPAAPDRPGAPGVILQDADQQELGIPMPVSAPAITGTYGTDPTLIERVLASVRRVVPQSAPVTRPSAGAAPTTSPRSKAPAQPKAPAPPKAPAQPKASPGAMPAGRPGSIGQSGTVGRPGSVGQSGTASPTVPATPSGPPSPVLTVSRGPQAGFDTCTAPSLQAMGAWRARFSATAIYIGGQEMACDYGNLSAAWVRQVKALGWSLLPTYVGPQAPCNNFSVKVDLKRAAAQGRQNAQWAVQDAATFGLGKGSPIYYDMEAYDNSKPRCATAVLTFLDAWTRQLNAEGYVSGVYSSAGSGVIDLVNNTKVAGHRLAEPQAIWFALWDNASDLNGTPYLPRAMWPDLHRSKQFAGSHWLTIRHITLNIDSDLVDGAVAP
ncbi:MAG TPA: glycoside hydrolase domain-containing protein [Streptosporangiaceae bacterium]